VKVVMMMHDEPRTVTFDEFFGLAEFPRLVSTDRRMKADDGHGNEPRCHACEPPRRPRW